MGGRSRVAAQLLSGKGFKEVYNMSGGIKAWDGGTAVGALELNLDLITGEESPEDVVRLAYCMEHALGGFYTTMKAKTEDRPVADLLGKLAGIEERHKQYLVDVYKTIDPAGIDKNELESSCSAIMEGGFKVEEFIKQNEQLTKTSADLIDLSMMLEAQALDLYMRFAHKSEKEETKKLLFKIGDEEKAHLKALGKLRDEVT